MTSSVGWTIDEGGLSDGLGGADVTVVLQAAADVRAAAAELVQRSVVARGLPETVEDDAVVRRVAVLLRPDAAAPPVGGTEGRCEDHRRLARLEGGRHGPG